MHFIQRCHLRSAHSRDPGLCFACGIDGCPKTFKNTNTYYKHVTSVHKNRYTDNSDVVLVKESLQTKHNAAKACSTTEDDSEMDDADTESGPRVAEDAEEDSESDALSECIDIVKVASSHLISLKCKAGVTQSLLPSIGDMNEAVIDGAVTNISSKEMERLQANVEYKLSGKVKDAIENPLRSLRTVYCQHSLIQAHY